MPDTIIKRRRWTNKGYHAYPLMEVDRTLPDHQKWLDLDMLVAAAKKGDFRRVTELPTRVAAADDWVRRGDYVALLGDAGDSKTLARVRDEILPACSDSVMRFVYAEALCYWGSLSAVPGLIEQYRKYHFSEDAWSIAEWMSRLMEEKPGVLNDFPTEDDEEGAETYCRVARSRYEELKGLLGTDDVVVFRGNVVGVDNICQRMLDDLRDKQFHEEMRHKFEAWTGVDCSGFYQHEVLQPLSAAAIIEDFLDSPERARYRDGERYFFGHRLA
ncbi:hypothetical protein HPC49_31635 [Pyxidicoccus fallax]|uniref:Uncharacterized protein n=1 Tax=Pyxidicoccus fallax TaxID=394095 RepID=A0A848LRP6_9BACT|nr:hypothetical protein [Pyxidicoccus fallax]NMO20361.1 hypothetical protein [Pyxidicoccus fallax]NPC82762.1 hypothetical protein [Pyxidicoccus fallax]